MNKLLLILLCLPMIGFGQNFSITQIPNSTLLDNTTRPSLYDGAIAWHDGTSNGDLFYWDGSATSIVAGGCFGGDISLYNGKIAFHHNEGVNNGTRVYYWNGSSVTNISGSLHAGWSSLYNGEIAFSGATGGIHELYYWNGTTTTQLTNNNFYGGCSPIPSLYDGKIAWLECGNLYYSDGNTTSLIYDSTNVSWKPSLHNGQIAFAANDGNDYEIYLWDGINIIQITNNSEDDKYPSLYNGQIAFASNDGNDYEIYFWDGINTIQVTNNSIYDNYPSLYDGNIAWNGGSGWLGTGKIYYATNLNQYQYGCTDSTAFNYNPLATVNDGSCIYPIYGCTDSTALNYDPLADTDDGSCIATVYGCMDSTATNYNATANTDDGSCTYCYATADIGADTILACDSTLISTNPITNGTYVWNSANIPAIGDTYQGGKVFYLDGNGGGLIAAPSNQTSLGAEWGCYGSNVSGAEGSVIGSGAQNTIDIVNANCVAHGSWAAPAGSNLIAAKICADLTLGGYSDWFLPSIDELNQMYLNYSVIGNWYPTAYWSSTESGNLNAKAVSFTGGGVTITTQKKGIGHVKAIRAFSAPINPDTTNSVTVSTSGWNYVTVTDSLGCTAMDSVYVHIDVCACTDSTALNYNPSATLDDGSCIATVYGCIDSTMLNYNSSANVDDGSCIPYVYGCMDSTATNYDLIANTDDGSCTLCYATIDFGTDTLNACDTAVITTAAITNATYSWSRVLDDPFPFGTVQQLLDAGYTPKEIYDNGYPLSLIYGSTYQGGTLMYLDVNTGYGLVTTYTGQWVTWGCEGTFIGGTSPDIGKGKTNTRLILDNCTERPIAASIADDLVVNGYDDWFLPSEDEALAIASNIFSNTDCWTSTEFDAYQARRIEIPYPLPFNIYNEYKYNYQTVYAVREFGATNTYTTNMPGTYFLTVTDSLGCSTTDSVHVDIYNSGCTDTAATNFDPLADGICNTGCTYCYATADFGTDTIQACDSILISVPPSITSTYSWVTSNPNTGSVQQLINNGASPLSIYKQGFPLDSLFGMDYQGGVIFYLDTIDGSGILVSKEYLDLYNNNSNYFNTYQYGNDPGCLYSILPTSYEIGTGRNNTDLMLSQCDSGTVAFVCEDLVSMGYNDWYIASRYELHELYSNLLNNGNYITLLNNNGYYWSSSQHSGTTNLAWGLGYSFIHNISYDFYKSASLNLLPVRSFTGTLNNERMISQTGWNYVTVTDSLGCTATDSVYVNVSVGGCMDPVADNYNPNATCENVACIYIGCMDSTSLTFNPNANLNDSTMCCYIGGCIDPAATNYDPNACFNTISCNFLVNNITQDTGYAVIQTAIDSSINGDTIIVSPGTFVENINFNGKNIVLASEFLLTGDTSYISSTIIDGNQNGSVVIFENGEDTTTVLSGFTIQNGYANISSYFQQGGGIYISSSSPNILSCLIKNNTSLYNGGGVYISNGFITPFFSNCVFIQNITQQGDGGAVFVGDNDAYTVFDFCTFKNNSASLDAGAIRFLNGSVKNCIISNNTAGNYGGGVVASSDQPGTFKLIENTYISDNSADYGGGINLQSNAPLTIINSQIVNNSASYHGGGIADIGSFLTIINSTISKNSASWGGGISCYTSYSTIFNSIISLNSASNGSEINLREFSIINIDNANIFGGLSNIVDDVNSGFGPNTINWGSGNIDVDPLFIDTINGDYSLSNFSHCIGAGTITGAPTTDILGNPRPNPSGSNPDMGAYEHVLGTYDILGCMDTLATNFDPTANINDSSLCTYCYAVADLTLDSIVACDSTVITTPVSIVSTYSWQTTNYTGLGSTSETVNLTGWNYVTVTDSLGCVATDSIYTTINYSNSSLETTTVCDSYLWNGVTYDSTGSYSALFTNVDGCDSTANLGLTVYYSNSSLETTTVCDSYLWNGVTYTATGVYDTIFTNVDGCDSTATLHLAINYSNSGSSTITACDSYFWQGITYTISGVYTNTLTNVAACDSIATLNLTINNSYPSSSNITDYYICDGQSVTIANSTYTNPGTYTDALTANNGCDSMVISIVHVSYLALTPSSTPVTCSNWNDGSVSVSANAGMPPYTYQWSTADTTSQVDQLPMGTYSVTVSDSACTITASATIQLNIAPADSMHPDICYVSVDNTGFNKVVLKPLANPLTAQYVIYSQYSANLYTPLDTLDANTLIYIDSTSNPAAQAERYKVSAIDACGNGTDTSAYHKTVHLTMSLGVNGEVNLIWNSYEGYQVTDYLIYRGNSLSNMNMISSTPGNNTSFTDLTPPTGVLQYQIRAFAQNCVSIANAFVLADTLESNVIDHNNTNTNTLTVTISSQNPTCPTCNDGYAVASASGGTSPYTYFWSTGSTNQFLMGLGVGTYTVFAFDATGNTATAIVTLSAAAPVTGCTDPTATNYDPTATVDDGSCTYVSCGAITGVYMSDVIHDRATFNWDDMNSATCNVDQIRFRYREVGTNSWSTKTMGVPVGSGCNTSNTSKLVLGLTPSTTYEYDFKIWYCNASTVNWHAGGTFTTAPDCDNVINVIPTPITTTKTQFCWDTVSTYAFVRLKYREDVPGSSFSNIGGMGVHSPTLCKDKNGLTPGLTYRVMWRTWCNPSGGPYRSTQWDGPVTWTQPNSIRVDELSSISSLEVYPNPSRDIFNIVFSSNAIQSLDVSVVNMLGEFILKDRLDDFIGEYTKQIDLSTNAKGIYFLEIETGDGVINKKLILQ